jgi:outer membrane protein assembly factor BamB
MGYLGDGSCVAPGTPPTQWSATENVKWRAPLANWGYGAPVVAARRVFVMTEPGWKHDFPLLNCFDSETGKLLWQREVNQLSATGLPDDRQQAVLKEFSGYLATWRGVYRCLHQFKSGDEDGARQGFAAIGIEIDPTFSKAGQVLRGAKLPSGVYPDAGFQTETWQHGGGGIGCVGQCFPTPVTDGEHVYVATAWMGFACYDMDGNLKWLRFSPGGYGGQFGVDYCKFARSPLLYKDLLISDMADLVRAFDKRTGELKWSHDKTGGKCTTIVQPCIATVRGVDVLISKNNAYRLPDGKELPVEGWELQGITRLVKSDERDVVFFTGGGEHGNWAEKGATDTPPPVVARFTLQEDKLKAEVLWSGVGGKPTMGHTGIVYQNGKLYHPEGYIFEALTGRVLAGSWKREERATPETKHMLWIAGGHVYGVASSGTPKDGEPTGRCDVFTLDGRKVASNVLPTAKAESEKADQIIQQTGAAKWEFSYSCPFAIVGDRIYIRSNDDLWCIGK